jgi:dTMP kinase
VARGRYIVIEGSDGTGKSTQVTLLRERLKERGIDSIEFHEPGGLPITDSIRGVILNGELERNPVTNLLLFTAARHELWKNARKKMKEGVWVIASRSYFSSLVYQGYGEGIDQELIRDTTLRFTDDLYMQPDLAIILSLEDEKEREARIGNRETPTTPDTFESKNENFQKTVADGYLRLARDARLPIISASQTIDAIASEIFMRVQNIEKHSALES